MVGETMAIVRQDQLIEEGPDGRRFIWPDLRSSDSWDRVRPPAGPDAIRQIEEISRAELRAARGGQEAVEVARRFDVRRLSLAA